MAVTDDLVLSMGYDGKVVLWALGSNAALVPAVGRCVGADGVT